MATPSTRKVTDTTLTPESVVGVAVSTTIRFTVVPGEASVMEEAVDVPPPMLEELELLLMLPLLELELEELELELPTPPPMLLLELEELELLVEELELLPVVLAVLELLIMLELELLELTDVSAAVTGVVVELLLPPQAARTAADNVAVTNRTMGLEQTLLKVSYIADSPCQGVTAWCW